jgi:hypothetical protein
MLKVSPYAVTLQMPVNMKTFNTFHMSMVRPYYDNGVPRQSEINDNIRANRGREVVRIDDGIEIEEWRYVKVMDFSKANNGRW